MKGYNQVLTASCGLLISGILGFSAMVYMEKWIPIMSLPWFPLGVVIIFFLMWFSTVENPYVVLGSFLIQLGGYIMLGATVVISKDPIDLIYWILLVIYVLQLWDFNEVMLNKPHAPILHGFSITLAELVIGALIFISREPLLIWLNILVLLVLFAFYGANSKMKFFAFLKWWFINRSK